MADQKSKSTSHVKHTPKDAQVIMSIMKDMGITEYEPRVINQLLEFTYRKLSHTPTSLKTKKNKLFILNFMSIFTTECW